MIIGALPFTFSVLPEYTPTLVAPVPLRIILARDAPVEDAVVNTGVGSLAPSLTEEPSNMNNVCEYKII